MITAPHAERSRQSSGRGENDLPARRATCLGNSLGEMVASLRIREILDAPASGIADGLRE
jgi:hypothetical protein